MTQFQNLIVDVTLPIRDTFVKLTNAHETKSEKMKARHIKKASVMIQDIVSWGSAFKSINSW